LIFQKEIKMANKKLSAFFQMDPFEKLNASSDSTVSIIKEGLKKNIKIWVGPPGFITFKKSEVITKGCEILDDGLRMGKTGELKINKLDFFFIRQDPPFDLSYLTNCYLLEIHKKFNKKPFFVNDPSGIKNFTEKIFPMYYPDLIPQTYITGNLESFKHLLKKYKKVVIKTLFHKGGDGVEKVDIKNPNEANDEFMKLINQYKVPVVVQKFIENVKYGDKRVILLDGNPVGLINRIPPKGQFKANLHLGGRAEITNLSNKEKEICKSLKRTLIDEKLFFVGIDLINETLTEVNVTSPTGIVQIKELSGINIAEKIWDELIAKNNL
tara:strand:- start:976 stop:1950 length:975 start_codon:yes stop_codon:yes gene_type:complete